MSSTSTISTPSCATPGSPIAAPRRRSRGGPRAHSTICRWAPATSPRRSPSPSPVGGGTAGSREHLPTPWSGWRTTGWSSPEWDPPTLRGDDDPVDAVRIEGDGIVLRELTDDDLDLVWAVMGDPVVVEHLPIEPVDRAGAAAMLDEWIASTVVRPRRRYVLALDEVAPGGPTTAAAAGIVTVSVDSIEHRRCEIGFSLRRERWGRGLATAGARAAVEFAFDHLGAHRVWAVCAPENPASARVLAKLGMRHEGTLRHDLLVHGRWVDSQMWAIIADDRVRAHGETGRGGRPAGRRGARP
ncbi:MAG: N-acetyltransferase [Actinomyces sp.]|nr:MAG: N-acetyltransferase [Actinomyces sp.]